jgi:uncharacterized protein (TIGR03437 family)
MRLAVLFVTLIIAGGAQPRVTAVVSAADSIGGISLGGLATIYGTGLSDAAYSLSGLPYPTKLGPTEVLLCVPSAAPYGSVAGCTNAGLTYASPTQINFAIPDSLPVLPGMGPESIAIVVRTNGVLDVDATAGKARVFNLTLVQPRIFSEGYDCLTDARYKDANLNCGLTFTSTLPLHAQADRGAVTDQFGAVLSSVNRARVGQYYTIWLTGLGPFTSAKTVAPVSPVALAFGDVPVYGYSGPTSLSATVSYVGPSQYPGLYQINFQLPGTVAAGGGVGFASPYSTPFPCGDYNWEISLIASQGTMYPTRANVVQIPVAVKNGDVPCTK